MVIVPFTTILSDKITYSFLHLTNCHDILDYLTAVSKKYFTNQIVDSSR